MADDSLVFNAEANLAPPPAPAQAGAPAGPDGDPAVWTVLGEAGGDPKGQLGVASTIYNRQKAGGYASPGDVVTDPHNGYESWQTAKTRAQIQAEYPPGSPGYQAAQSVLAGIQSGQTPPLPYDSFYSPKAQAAFGRPKPAWDDGTGTDIGGNLFFQGKYSPGGVLTPDEQAAWDAVGGPKQADVTQPGPLTKAPMGASDALKFMDVHGLRDQGGASIGSRYNPEAMADGGQPPADAGTWYVTPQGQIRQAGDPTPDYIPLWRDAISKQPGAIGETARGLIQGVGPDLARSVSRLTGGGIVNAGVDPMQLAYDQAVTGTDPRALPNAALQGEADQARDYDIANVGSKFAQAGRFGGQAVPATVAALAVPEIAGPDAAASGALASVGRVAAPITSNALRGVASAATNVGANPNQSVLSQLGAGAALGAAVPLALGGIGKTGVALSKGIGNAISPPTVEDKVAGIIQKGLARDNINPADAAQAALDNPARPAFHAGGPNTAATADAIAQSPGPGNSIIRDAVSQHQADAPAQVRNDINRALGGNGDYLSALDSTIAARRTEANQTMGRIADSPIQLSPDAISALRSDRAKSAISEAAQNALASPDPEVRASGAALNRVATDALDNPSAITLTVRNAQDISKSLLDAADAAYKGGDGARGLALKTLGRSVRDTASASNPDYAGWLSRYGSDSDNLDALQLGHNVFSQAQGNTSAQVQKTLGAMGPQALSFYQKGVAEALIDQSRTAKGGVGTMRQLLRTQDLSDKVRAAFPDDASFSTFLDSAQQRVREQDANQKILGGSPTYARQAARQDLEAQPFHPLDAAGHALDVTGNILTGNFGTLAGKTAKAAFRALPRSDRSLVGNPITNSALGSALSDPGTFADLATRTPRTNWGVSALQGAGAVSKPVEIPLSALTGVRFAPQIGRRKIGGVSGLSPVGANAQ